MTTITPRTYYVIRPIGRADTKAANIRMHVLKSFSNAKDRLAYYQALYPNIAFGISVLENQANATWAKGMFRRYGAEETLGGLPEAAHIRWAVMPHSHTMAQYTAPYMAKHALKAELLRPYQPFLLTPPHHSQGTQTAYFDEQGKIYILRSFVHETMY